MAVLVTAIHDFFTAPLACHKPRSFPRKRESRTKLVDRQSHRSWIPAFAGMSEGWSSARSTLSLSNLLSDETEWFGASSAPMTVSALFAHPRLTGPILAIHVTRSSGAQPPFALDNLGSELQIRLAAS
jgi:hypothetical protein